MFHHKLHSSKPRVTRLPLVAMIGFLSIVAVVTLLLAVDSEAAPQRHATLGREAYAGVAKGLLAPERSKSAIRAQQQADLELSIISSPWATRDHNWSSGSTEEVPRVLVVEAVVSNTSSITATNLTVLLDYNEDPANNWVLLPGENPERTVDELAAGEAYYAYWFARHSLTLPPASPASHQYTVTAYADNTSLVSTSDNYYGNPEPGATVQTRATQSTGNSGVTQISADVTVGVAFTVTIDYGLGTNAREAAFGPAGNIDFDPSAYRLLASEVRFYNNAGTQQSIVRDHLYFDTLPAFADNAEVTLTFVALTPANTRLCSYTAVGYQSTYKYDQFYCVDTENTVIPITGTLSISSTKQANSPTVQQNQILTYTLTYTNNGDLTLVHAWIWDEIDANLASIIPSSIDPPSDPDETTGGRVAWYLNDIQPGERGTFTFAVRVDGGDQDVADGTSLVNHAFVGINEGSLPETAALTNTLTTTIEAPTVAVSKTDGQATAEPGEALLYTLSITNSGAVTTTGLVVTDILPADVNYVPDSAIPPETSLDGRTLTWIRPDISPGGGIAIIQIPVTVALQVPNGTVLDNEMTVAYQNPAGWTFATQTASDATLVDGPVLTISKSAYPDPVLTNHVITYTLAYSNSGPAAASNVLITDVVPANTTYQSCNSATCSLSDGVVSWEIGTVPADSSGTVTFSVLVDSDLQTGDLIRNEEYGILSDQTPFVSGPPVLTTVSREAAFVEGYTFIDLDGDGEYDVGSDDILPGVDITLPRATVPVVTTDPTTGYYHFRVEVAGAISVTADLPAGYFRTTPGTIVFLDSVFGITRTVNFGYAPDDESFGVLYGTVFEDTDHDGVQTEGEDGLAGVSVSSPLAATSPVTTNELGQYSLYFDSGGSVTVTETDPAFYVSTTPNQVVANAVIGSSGPSPIDFGDFQGIQITGQVFDDLDVDGVNDDGAYVAGAVVAADGNSVTTDSSGVYTLYVTLEDSGLVTINETDPTGYVSTNAVPGNGMTQLDANTLQIATSVSGTVYANGDFGDVQASGVVTISGQVWDDNGAGGGGLANGVRDGTEPGLAGATVSVGAGLEQTTGADGSFLLYAPPDQEMTISEANPAGYASTNAIAGSAATKIDNDTLVMSGLSGGATSAGHLFGDVQDSSVAIISGSVFNDANENGLLDAGETGLADVPVTLEFSDGRVITVTTNLTGEYQFAVAPGTEVRLSSAGPGGAFYPTTPESMIVAPPTSGTFPGNDFGYSDDPGAAVIAGLVFDDVNGDGDQDFGEPGLAGATITLNGGDPVTTGQNGLIVGTFSYAVTQAGVYAVHEANPTGYRSTTPDDLNIAVTLGNGYSIAFGDTINSARATVFGTVFDDLNGDGQQGATEPGLAGVVISVTVGEGIITETTGAFGQYSFGFGSAEAGFHTVSEQDPARPGYRSTTPDEVNVLIELGNSYGVNFGDTQADTFSTVMGTVFDDESGEGVQDPGELGIPNVTVALSDGRTTTTNANGGYTFAITEVGTVQVTETDPAGYHSTTPNTVVVDVAALGQLYVVDFGDSDDDLVSSFFGTVFDDLNANGAWDEGEPPLSGVSISISGAAFPVLTNPWGQFTFLIENPGTYTISETDPPGYVSTNAIPGGPGVTRVDDNTLRAVVSLGTDLGDNLFGDVLASQVVSISGTVWNDNGAGGGVPGDGIRNGAEPGLVGATVSLSSGMAQTTGPDGSFLLYTLAGQTVTLHETNPPGYISTNAIPGNDAEYVDEDTLRVRATLPAGGASTNNLFGDRICSCGGDDYEEDDTPAQANLLMTGETNKQSHTFCDDAVDWVEFTAQARSIYTITTSSWGQRADTFLALFEADGSTLLAANDDYAGTMNFSSRIVWEAPKGGTYLLRITNRAQIAGCDTEYDVWLESEVRYIQFLPLMVRNSDMSGTAGFHGLLSTTGIINHICPDAYETDDTWQQAHSVEPGVLQIHSFDSDPQGFAADKDFVEFELMAGQTVTFTVGPITNTQTLLELYDRKGAVLPETGMTQLIWTPEKDGRYFLSVSPMTITHGCADQVGYGLLMEQKPMFKLLLPLVVKNY